MLDEAARQKKHAFRKVVRVKRLLAEGEITKESVRIDSPDYGLGWQRPTIPSTGIIEKDGI